MPSITRLNWATKTTDDEVDHTTINSLGSTLDDTYDVLNEEHDPSTGNHDTPVVARGTFKVTEAAGTYTLKESSGIIASITDNGTGDVSINLSSNLDDDGAGTYVYPVILTLDEEPGSVYVDTRTTSAFDVNLTDMSGTAADRAFSGAVFGVLA